MDDKLNQLLKKELITSLQLAMTNTLVIQVGVHVPQIQSLSSLVTHPTPRLATICYTTNIKTP
jgi:hypothetical protein